MADNIVKIHFKPDGDESLVRAIKALDKETKKLLNTQAKIIDSNKKHTVSQKQGKTQAEKNAIALDKLRVKLTALGFDYNKVVVSNKHFGSALAGSRVSLEKVTLATKKYIAEQTKADISTRILGGSFAVLRSQLLLFNFAMALGVRQLLRFTQEFAKVESMERSFNALSGGAENAQQALSQLRQATNNTMSSFDLFQQANNAMVLGVAKSSNEMAEMFDIAQRLGNALGRDTAQSVESLVTGIGRQSRLMLDNIGIMVRSSEAYENYAKQINKNASDLTDLEKKQAFTNETMKQARLLAKLLAPEVETTQMAFDSLGASASDLSVEIGKALAPSLKVIAEITRDLTDSLDASDFKTFFNGIMSLATAYGVYKTAVLLATTQQKAFNVAILKNPIGLLVGALTTLTFTFLQYNDELKNSSNLTKEQLDKKEDLADKANILRQSIKELINQEETANDVIERNIKLRDKQIKNSKSINTSLTEELIQLKLKRAELEGASEAQLKSLQIDIEHGKERKNLTGFQQLIIDQILKETLAIQNLKIAKESELKSNKKLNEEKEKSLKLDEDIENFRSSKGLERFKASEEAKNAVLKTTSEKRLSDLLKLEMQFFSSKNLTDQQMLEADMFFSEQRKQIFAEEMQARTAMVNDQVGLALGAFNGLTGAMEQDLERRKQNELNALRSTNRFQRASAEERKNMEHEVTKSFAKEEIKIFNMKKNANLVQIAMDTASAVVEALPNIPLSVLVGALGLAQAGIVASQPPPSFESGGLVGGNRHSQGGTIIEAERGEFVMSRNAVQSLGVETMNEINQGRSMPSVNINISAPLVDDSVVDNIIPAINKALRNGRANIGA